MQYSIIALLCGLLFGTGLTLSGMTDTSIVLGFFDLAGQWDPTLAFVMGSALLIALPGYKLIFRRSQPLLHTRFELPGSKNIDRRLLIGAAIFGTGWGLYGFCPGPAIASLTYLQPDTFIFLAAMAAGAALASAVKRRLGDA